MKISVRETMTPMRGCFSMRIYKKGILIDKYEEKNLIVSGARTVVANHLLGECEGGHIANIAFGTCANIPTPDDATITNPFIKPLLACSLLTPTQLEFKWDLLADEANGMKIIEFGLLCQNGTLFARKLGKEALPKEQDYRLEGEWIILL